MYCCFLNKEELFTFAYNIYIFFHYNRKERQVDSAIFESYTIQRTFSYNLSSSFSLFK